MAVSSRDILFLLRAQDFASREINNVTGAFKSLMATQAASNASVVAAQAAYQSVNQQYQRAAVAARQLNAAHAVESAVMAANTAAFGKQSKARNQVLTVRRAAMRVEAAQSRQELANLAAIRVSYAQTAAAEKARHEAAMRNMQAEIAARQSLARRIGATGLGLTAIGTIAAASGVATVGALNNMANAAADWDQQIRYAATQTDGMADSVDELNSIATAVGSKYGVELGKINDGLFDILSTVDVGLPAAGFMLENFAKGAVAGNTDVQAAAAGTIALMNQYQQPVSQVTRLLDLQFATVRDGKGEFAEFNKELGDLAPIANMFNQSIEEMLGNLIFITRGGIPASEAVTQISRAMEALYRPEALDFIEGMGIAVEDQNGELRQMSDLLNDILTDGGFAALSDRDRWEALETMFGREGRVTVRKYFGQIFERGEELLHWVDRVKDSNGLMEESYELMAEGAAHQLQLLRNNWELLRIEIGYQVIPILLRVTEHLRIVVQWLRELSPETKRQIVQFLAWGSAIAIVGGIMTALVGVILMMASALVILFPALSGVTAILAVLGGGLLIAAVIAALIALIVYWDEVKAAAIDFYNTLRDAFTAIGKLPKKLLLDPLVAVVEGVYKGLVGLQKAFVTSLQSIARVVHTLVTNIYKMLQYLNPFARHSPSLVDNVTEGVQVILDEYGKLSGIVPAIDSARQAVQRLKDDAASLSEAVEAAEQQEILDLLRQYAPAAVNSYGVAREAVERLRAEQQAIVEVYEQERALLDDIQKELDAVTAEYEAQQAVIETLKRQKVDLNRTYELEKRALDDIRDALDRAKDEYDSIIDEINDIEGAIGDAQRAMQEFANAPLTGQRQFENQMFDLEQQARAVELQMAKWEAAGAPPEALDFFNYQLDAIQAKMDELRLSREIETAPLRKQLQDLASTTEELTFEQARDGILAAQEQMQDLENQLPDLNKKAEAQGKIVEALTKQYELQSAIVEQAKNAVEEITRAIEDEEYVLEQIRFLLDDINEQYENQEAIVDSLRDAYDSITDEIGELEGVIDSIIDLAEKQKTAMENATGATDDLANAFQDLDPALLGEIGAGLDDIGDYEIDTQDLEDMLSGIDNIFNALPRFMGRLREATGEVRNFLGVNALVGPLGVLFYAYRDKVGSALGSVRRTVDETGRKWGEFRIGVAKNLLILKENVETKAREIITAMKVGLENKVSDVLNWFRKLPSRIATSIGDMWSKGKTLGSDFVAGIKKGIEDGASKILRAAVKAVRDAFNAAKRWLMSSSPSKRTMQLGNDFSKGFAIGIDDAANMAVKAARAVSDSTLGQIDPSAFDFSSTATSTGVSPVVRGNNANSTMGNTTVTVEEGAFQFNGPIDSATLPQVEEMLQEFMDELVDEILSGNTRNG